MRSTRLPSSIERFLGFGPRPLPPHVFFLSGRQLAYASFTGPGGDRRGLAAFRRVALPPDLFTPGPLAGPARDPAVLADALRELTQAFPEPVEEASLVVPDAWMRVTFTEGGDLPDNPRVRDEAVRFKLKRLVPFRVEELRVYALEVGDRLVIGFALDNLLSQVEGIFEEQGVRLGQIVNASFALAAAVEPPPGEVLALALVEEDGYALTFVQGPEPLLHRFKAGEAALDDDGDSVRRDLQLTRSFMHRQLGNQPVGRALLVAPPEIEARWLGWLREGLNAPAEAVSAVHLPVEPSSVGTTAPWPILAPMLGAAVREVP